MRAFVIPQLDGPQAGLVTDFPEPTGAHAWAAGQRLLIQVHSAGVSFPDVLQTRGLYQHAAEAPYVAGGEVCGVVLEAPEGSRFKPGDRVASLTMWGGIAERALGLPVYTMKIPDSMTDHAGAALVLNYSTAWFSLYRSMVKTGDTILVHGAAGGVGTATLQVAKAQGVRTIALVSSETKAEVARKCGADFTLMTTDPWVQGVKDLTDGRGVDVVIDPVGGDRFTDSLRSLDIGGRLAVVGFAGGAIPEVKVNRLLLRDLSVVGVALAPYIERFPETAAHMTSEIEAMCTSGAIDPYISHVLPMDESAEALSLIDRREATGKVVVSVEETRG